MRLIDADALKEAVNDKKVVGRFNTIQLIDNAPTIEPVKQCKFCKHCGDEDYCSNCHSDHSLFEHYSRPQGKEYVNIKMSKEEIKQFKKMLQEHTPLYNNIFVEGASVERPQGEWIENTNIFGEGTYECSNCGNPWSLMEGTPADNDMNFCPNCGAKMMKEAENEDSN